jgi:hypothetical protein
MAFPFLLDDFLYKDDTNSLSQKENLFILAITKLDG